MTHRQGQAQPTTRQLDIMIEQILPPHFNLRVWQLISSKSPQEFISNQQDILNILLSDPKLFQAFFLRFYTNHQHLNNWYMLANANHIDIKQYVFTGLLAKTLKEYREINKKQHKTARFNRTHQIFRQKQQNRKERKKQSFHKMYLSNAKSTNILQPHAKLQTKTQFFQQRCEFLQKEIQKQDYHELFLKTFSACDGSKYIYYDFNKHMRGISGKKRYNDFIRIKKHKKNQSNNIEFNLSTDLLNQDGTRRGKCIRSSHNSLYVQENIDFLHQKEDLMANVNYCNFQMDAIGQIKKSKYMREALLLKRTIKGLKKVKVDAQRGGKFQLKKRKVL